MGKRTNIAQSLKNIAIEPCPGVELKDVEPPLRSHFSTESRLKYYADQLQRIQIERAKKASG